MLDDPLNLRKCMMQQVFSPQLAPAHANPGSKDLLNTHFFITQQVFSPTYVSNTAQRTYSTLTFFSLSRSSRPFTPSIRLKRPTQRSLLTHLVGLLAHSRFQSGSKDLLNAHISLTQQVFSPIHASNTALKTYSTLTSHSLSRSSHSSSLQPTLIPAKKTYSSHLSSLIVGLQRHSK